MSRFITVDEAEAMVQAAVAKTFLKIAPRPFKVFGLNGSLDYANRVASHLGISLTRHEEKLFPDG